MAERGYVMPTFENYRQLSIKSTNDGQRINKTMRNLLSGGDPV